MDRILDILRGNASQTRDRRGVLHVKGEKQSQVGPTGPQNDDDASASICVVYNPESYALKDIYS